MTDDVKQTLRTIVRTQVIASLGTLHAGEPAVSMVPFAVHEGALVIHVSGLSSHTADMLAHPRVSVLVTGPADGDTMPQAIPRFAVTGDAERLESDSAEEAAARAAYERRFPDASPMFGLGDFSLFSIRPRSVRVIGGFGRANTISAGDFRAAMSDE